MVTGAAATMLDKGRSQAGRRAAMALVLTGNGVISHTVKDDR